MASTSYATPAASTSAPISTNLSGSNVHGMSSTPVPATPLHPTHNNLPAARPLAGLDTNTSLASNVSSSELAAHAESPLAPIPSAIGEIQGAVGKRQRERERRIMPARLRRVSNLLAGSTIEDELLGTNSKMDESYVLPPETQLLLTTNTKLHFSISETTLFDGEGDYFSEMRVEKACRATQLIETPDFRTRDDTEMMGKTRSIRSEEDTSDAAYERRHRKPDNLEKKQRRLEKERLVRDRQKLKERIDQLRVADSRLLMPILTAREQRQSEGDVPTNGEVASPRGVEATYGLGKHSLSVDAALNLSKLELLRTELLEEAHETMKRYDALLTPTETVPPLNSAGKRKAGENGTEDERKAGRSISLSGAFASKKNAAANNKNTPKAAANSSAAAAAAAAANKKAKRSSLGMGKSGSPSTYKRLSLGAEANKSPIPFKPEDGSVRAENTYANIHARTKGGRFAPKSALAGVGGSTSKINTKGKWKAEGQAKPPKRKRSASSSAAGKSKTKESLLSASKSLNNLIESSGAVDAENKPRRVKIVINKRGKGSSLADEKEGSSVTSSSSVDVPAVTNKEENEMEVDVTPQRAVRSALTLEEAQALLAKAMEDEDDDDEEEATYTVKREDASYG